MASKKQAIKSQISSFFTGVRPLEMLLYGILGKYSGSLLQDSGVGAAVGTALSNTSWGAEMVKTWPTYGGGLAKTAGVGTMIYEIYRGLTGKFGQRDLNAIIPLTIGFAADPVDSGTSQSAGSNRW